MSSPSGISSASTTPYQQAGRQSLADSSRLYGIRAFPELRKAHTRDELGFISLLAVLDADDRPTFIVDLSSPPSQNVVLEPVYCNPSLTAFEGLLQKVTGEGAMVPLLAGLEPPSKFRNWLLRATDEPDAPVKRNVHLFEGYIWSATSIGRYRIVSGISTLLTRPDRFGSSYLSSSINPKHGTTPEIPGPSSKEASPAAHSPAAVASKAQQSPFDKRYGPYDYTLDPPFHEVASHISHFRGTDWSQTPIGPIKGWSPELRCITNMVMNDPCPAVLYWGDDASLVYNEAYVELLGVLHPCMGRGAHTAASVLWDQLHPLVERVSSTGETLSGRDLVLFLNRNGLIEEASFTFQLIPVLNKDGYIAGYYQPLVETTQSKLFARRSSFLADLASRTAKARDRNAFWEFLRIAMSINENDVPLALVYSAENESEVDSIAIPSPRTSTDFQRCVLQTAIGVSRGQAIAPSIIDMHDGSSILAPMLSSAASSRQLTFVELKELDIPEAILKDIRCRDYGDVCRSLVIFPLLPTPGEGLEGFLILGMSPRRPLDEEYQQFLRTMHKVLTTSLASVVLFEEEIRQKEHAICQTATILEKLKAELQLTEKKFELFADQADVGIFITDENGRYLYRNHRWYDIFHAAADTVDLSSACNNTTFSEDLEFCEGILSKVIIDKSPVSFELKTTRLWTPPETLGEDDKSLQHYVWILCSMHPQISASGALEQIMGNVTDISKLKWAEEIEKSRTDLALKSKSQLENFIDTTSHELRNPLSAIIQCADSILSSYSLSTDGDSRVPSPKSFAGLMEHIFDSAQTVAQCGQHMKRVVDDILTISKLDSGLLTIAPIDVQPEQITQHALKMFQAEAKSAGVDLGFDVDQSFRDMECDWVSLDPTRFLQVLINLITNAIKFTRLEPYRVVSATLGAQPQEPKSIDSGVQFTEATLVGEDEGLRRDWEQGEVIFLSITVKDTGRGLNEEEKAKLFTRFTQASPRTHIHYGGSGLGLFISRRLVEMQGGRIGLASAYKKGCTFAFYIKARKIPLPRTVQSTPFFDALEVAQKSPRTPRILDGPKEPLSSPPLIRTSSSLSSSPLPSAPESPRGDALRVLVVEDNLVNQKLLVKQLRKLNCIVSSANHGAEALEHLKLTKYWDKSKMEPDMTLAISSTSSTTCPLSADPPSSVQTTPSARPRESLQISSPRITPSPSTSELELDVILMDWEMPVMNGVVATAKIRELERAGALTKHIPVIGVTANVREQQVKTAHEAGMDDVLGKPFLVKELMTRMRRAVQESRLAAGGTEIRGMRGEDGSSAEDGGMGSASKCRSMEEKQTGREIEKERPPVLQLGPAETLVELGSGEKTHCEKEGDDDVFSG